jgi:hypothetical protein
VHLRRELDTAQNALFLVCRDVVPRQPVFQFLGMALRRPLQRRRRTTEELDRITMDGTMEGNLRAHRASTYDANRFKGSCGHGVRVLSCLQTQELDLS